MQVETISSPAASSPLALRERKVGGKEEHFLLSRACSGLQHRAALQFSAFTHCRGIVVPPVLRSHDGQIILQFVVASP